MSDEFSFSDSSEPNKIPSSFLLSHHFFNMFFFIFLCSFSPLFFSTLFLLALFPPPPPNPDHGGNGDDSPGSNSKLGFLLSLVESLVRKLSSKNEENYEGISCFEEFQAYLNVFREPVFEVLEEKSSESGFSGEEGRESGAHVGPMENKPNGNFDQNPFGKDDEGKLEGARPLAEEKNKFCEKECNEVLVEKFSESGNSGDDDDDDDDDDDGRESSRNHVGPQVKEPSFDFDENPFEKDEGKLESARPIAGEENKFCESDCSGEEEGRKSHVDLIEDPTVNLEEKPAGEEEEDYDVDKVGKNTKLEDMICQKKGKEVKPLDTDPNKAVAGGESKEKMALRRSGSKVTANSEEQEQEECFGTPESYWECNKRRRRSYGGSMRKEKEWRRTLAFKLYEERNNNVEVDNGSSSSNGEAMDLLWETYEVTEHRKVKEKSSESIKDDDEDEDEEEEEEEEEEKEKGLESKYCCLQALKFSAGKVNLGMRKPSLVKISKALKSIGFLHHVSKHGRKKIH